MKKIELLSPAGNKESLIAAIEAGCDAVYLGGTMFGARAFAGNFDNDELVEAIKYAHLYGVKVYVTTNILIYEHEVNKFMEYVDFLYKNNVDALIIQDLGMLDLVHKTYPNLELHASTQMHIHNLDSTIMALKLGVKRVVLARETPIELVREIKEKTNADLEIFAHGALCVSYSGQCLFSSLIGNRSGNRGTCVGSCRLPYKVLDENKNVISKDKYPLSMKDLNTLEHIGDLIDANVTSLKLEGRMKSKEYVYTVTKLYRMAIDSYYENGKVYIDQKELDNLQKIFSRGYTKGYLFKEKIENIISNKPNHQGIEIGKVISYKNNFIEIKLYDAISINDGLRITSNDDEYGFILNQFYINKKLVKQANKDDIISVKVNKEIKINSKVLLTKDDSLINDIENKINLKSRKIDIVFNIKAKLNQELELTVYDEKNTIKIKGNIIEKSKNKSTTKLDIENKLNKIGNTIYRVKNIEYDIDNDIFIPLSELNNIRREILDKLSNLREYKYDYKKENYLDKIEDVEDFNKEEKTSLKSEDKTLYKDYDYIYNNENTLDRVMFNYPKSDKEYLVGELGALNKIHNVISDYSFNVVNSYTVNLLHRLGVKRVTLSVELTDKQIENLINAYKERYKSKPNLELIIYGKLEVMILKTNLNKIYNKKILYLEDKYSNYYLVKERNNNSIIYDYKIRDIYSKKYYDLGINVLRYIK